jgi:hypothetical protein
MSAKAKVSLSKSSLRSAGGDTTAIVTSIGSTHYLLDIRDLQDWRVGKLINDGFEDGFVSPTAACTSLTLPDVKLRAFCSHHLLTTSLGAEECGGCLGSVC